MSPTSPPILPQSRERNIAEARHLFGQARQRGSIPLPQLTDLDLCVFSESFFPALETQVWQRWTALPEHERTALAQRARGFLEHRKLLRPTGPGEYLVQPKLAIILGTRAQPHFTGICSVPGRLGPGDLRLFGMLDETHDEPMMVLERGTTRGLGEFGRIRQYSLATVDTAGAVAADWIRNSAETEPDRLPRLAELYRADERDTLVGERLSVLLHNGQYSLTHTQGSAVACVDRLIEPTELATLLANRLRTVAR